MVLLTISIGKAQKLDSDRIKQFDQEITQISKIDLINGFGITILTKDSILFSKGYGYANREKEIPYSSQTLQNIGSVSKTLIGLALLRCEEMGKLYLDDPITKYLDFVVKNPYYPNTNITIRQLATHTSTIQDTDLYDQKAYYVLDSLDLNLPSTKAQSEEFQTLESKVSMKGYLKRFLSPQGDWYSKKNFLRKRPGTKYEYTNVGATLAAHIIETVSGSSYDQFTKKEILEALNMEASGWKYNQIDVSHHSILYNADKIPLPKYALVTYPDGGLITNHQNLSKYLMELMKAYEGDGSASLLRTKSYAELFKQQLPKKKMPKKIDNKYDDEFNSGIFMGFTPVGWVGHSGSDPGILCFLFFDPKIGIGHILTLNTSLNGNSINKQLIPILEAIDSLITLQ
ncbi:MAG: serine hydrolase domain-containing protein [Bacteroidota bacterium]